MTDTDLCRLEAKVDEVLRHIRAQGEVKKPGLSIAAFAKAAGISEKTVTRRLATGALYRVKGKIPYQLLSEYLS